METRLVKTRAIIMAGGEGSRLGILTAKRTKSAVPFAGKYRIIDFTLSNCVNSGIFDVMILAQYRPHSLIEHIGAGLGHDGAKAAPARQCRCSAASPTPGPDSPFRPGTLVAGESSAEKEVPISPLLRREFPGRVRKV